MFERPLIDNRLQPPTEPGGYESGLRRPAPDEEAARYLAAIALVVPECTRVIDPNTDVRKLFQQPAGFPQQQHLDRLAYAQQVLAELGMPIAEGSVEGLSLRYGRSTFGATLVDGRNVVVRTHSGAFIGEDPNTKYINRRGLLQGAGIITPNVLYNESAAVCFDGDEHATLCLMVEERFMFPSWQDYLARFAGDPERYYQERVKAYIRLAGVLKRLHAIPAKQARGDDDVLLSEYGQYATQDGRIPTHSSFHEYVMAYVTKSKSVLAAGTKYPDLFPINSQLVNRAGLFLDYETTYCQISPHLIHGDAQLANFLTNDGLIDPSYLGAGGAFMDWMKVIDNETVRGLKAFETAMRSPDGMGLSKNEFNTILKDARTWAVMDHLDRMASQIGKFILTQNDHDAIHERRTGQLKAYRQELGEAIRDPVYRRRANQEYLGDYRKWRRQAIEQERQLQSADILQVSKKFIATQKRLEQSLSKAADKSYRGWRTQLVDKAEKKPTEEEQYAALDRAHTHYTPWHGSYIQP